MIVIAAVDDCMGMMFNKRRQSQDRVLRQRIISLAEGKNIWMNAYGLVIGAYSGAENDYELMYDRIVNSSLEGYSSKSSVTKFFYEIPTQLLLQSSERLCA